MAVGSLRKIEFQAKNLLTGKVESVVIETEHSQLGDLCGQGWAAALNGFDVDAKTGTGKTEAAAIAALLERCDLERIIEA